MSNIKIFCRSTRKELNRISLHIKQIDFKVSSLRRFLRRRVKRELQELKQMKAAIIHKLKVLITEPKRHFPTMRAIHSDIEALQEKCHQFKTKYF